MKKGTNMRRIALILFFLSVAGSLVAETKKGITISGHLDGLQDGDVVKLGNRFADWHYITWMDSCVIVNGNFHFQNTEAFDEPMGYEIYFHKGVDGRSTGEPIDYINLKGGGARLGFLAQNGDQIRISGNANRWNDIIISGSPSNDAYVWSESLAQYASRSNIAINARLSKIRDSIGYDKMLVGELVKLKEGFTMYLDSATKNVLPAYQIGILFLIGGLHDRFSGYHGYFQKKLFSSLSPTMQNSALGKRIRRFALLSTGQPMPDFSLPTLDGKIINLKNFASKNKITLVHFWGTNSVSREMFQKELKIMYDKFLTKGLNVIAVSADTSRDEWEIMVRIKKFPWINVISEPKGWGEGSLINDVYGEGGHSIPNTTNVLLDSKGNILAWDVSGLELQYYLEKYLGS